MPQPSITALDAEYVPAAQDAPGHGRDLLVVLHGLGDSRAGFAFLPEILGLPTLGYLLVNAPAPYHWGGFAWYDPEDPEPGILHSRARLQGLLAELAAQGWPPARTMLLGFSQGCLMTVDVGLRHPDPLAGLVGLSGYVWQPEQALAEAHPQARDQHWLITHGYQDEVLPFARSQAQFAQLRAAGIPLAWHEFHKGHTLEPAYELPLLQEWIAGRFAAPDSTV